MSLGVSARLKYTKKHELVKSHSQSQLLANKLRQDGVLNTVENVMQAVDQVASLLASSKPVDPTISYKDSIINLYQHLKVYGAYLEILYQDQLNRAFVVFRDRSQDDIRLDYLSRLHLLELIELRAKGWKGNDIMNQYYRKKIEQSESASSLTESMTTIAPSPAPLLGPGEVIKPSGKFSKPTRIPGKNYCKDEVVIRNADSGKVMGIKGRRVHMIEELSETIISFQKVTPGAKERLVQITGANEESINHAKQLIEDTIKRNASPVREHGIAVGGPLTGSSSSINSSASDDSALPQVARSSRALLHSLSTNDASIGEYKYTIVTGGHTIKITGDNLDLVRTSKLILDEYFSGEPIQDIGQFYSFDSLPQAEIVLPVSEPLSPPESLPSPNVVPNGQVEEPPQTPTLRRPHTSIDEVPKEKSRLIYSIEFLARLAMSPLCLSPPIDLERITNQHPTLIRKLVEMFDAKQYLTNRMGEPLTVLSADEVEAADV
ncbi:eukaryotic translation initiation factor 4E-binding protein Mextli isoform X1 [Onthophagus taurus]|uniref:eukaryotic translation initiation factor 4E-binding protein Mextli isoform X1 n=1 Tax=Onthophagus taurus TaxID=166361 RepID=UPI000C209EF1|nr:eukaryotic translation initiation factor 4E-binding protein Mextli isoform X1 [Onthophagus taurus]